MAKLEEKAVNLGTVTHAGLEESIMKCFEKSGVMQLVRNMENPPHSMETSIPASASPPLHTYTWGGKLHYFPEDFAFPKESIPYITLRVVRQNKHFWVPSQN